MATRAELANHLDLSVTAVSDLRDRGIIPRDADLDTGRVAYIRYLRGRAAGHVSEDGLDLTAERARLAKEQADAQALKNAELRGELVRIGDAEGFVLALCSASRAKILAVPSKAAPDAHAATTTAECETAIRRHVTDALEELAESEVTVAYAGHADRSARARRSSSAADLEAAEPDERKRVGRGKKAGSGRDEPGAGSVEEQALPA